MNVQELRDKLKAVEQKHGSDYEVVHGEQDELLLEYINDPEVTKIFNRSTKWYA